MDFVKKLKAERKSLLVESRTYVKRARAIQRAIDAIEAAGLSSNSGGRRTLSAAARRKISLAQKKRWAAARKAAS
jgi:hypothetical protein